MRIRRIEIRNFRRFRKPLIIDGIGDGLTVLAGDNEEGKSTVLKALRTVLFDRYKLSGADVQRLQPHGSDVQPEVKLDFELGGARYSLHKGFIHQPFARLVTPEGPLLNMAAEERLQHLLRYEPPGKGAAKLEHQGIFSLFWLEQGSGFDNLPVRSQVKQTLVSALEGEVGAVLGGEQGRAVIAGVAQRYAELFTAQAKPRGDLKKAGERVEQLEAELVRIENELHGYDEKVDVLSKTRARLVRSEQERLLELAQERLEEQRREVQRIERLAERVREHVTAEELARAQHEAALERWREREKKSAAAARAQARAEQQGQLLVTERAALDPELEACAQLREALEAAERELVEAERGVQDWEARRERARAQKSAADLQRRLELAQAAQRAAEQARARLGTCRLDDRRLRELRRLERAVIEAEAGLQAVATRVELLLEPGQLLRIDGEARDPNAAAYRALEKKLLGDHPYARSNYGTKESMSALTTDDLRQFMKDRLTRDHLFVAAAGDINAADLGKLVDRAFGGLPATGIADNVPEAKVTDKGSLSVLTRNVPQATVIFAQPGIKRSDKDFFATYLMNYVLGGGGFSSRLMTEIREKRGLTYGVNTDLATLDHVGFLSGRYETPNAKVKETLELLRKEWQRMAAEGPTQTELDDARTYLLGYYPRNLTTTSKAADTLLGIQMEHLGIDYIERRRTEIEAVTLDDVKRVAKTLLNDKALTIVVAGKPEGLAGATPVQ